MKNLNRTLTLALSLALCLSLPLSAKAEGKTIALKAAPAAVQKALTEQAKGGTIKSVSVETEDGKTEYEAVITGGGKDRTVAVDAAGKLLESETEVEFSTLPAPVKAALTKEAGKGKVTKVEEVTEGGVVSYEGLVKEAGKKDREVVVGADGKVVPAKK
jgi:uncharacterized membrane protein YkoI